MLYCFIYKYDCYWHFISWRSQEKVKTVLAFFYYSSFAKIFISFLAIEWKPNVKTRMNIIWKKESEFNTTNLLSQIKWICGYFALDICVSPANIVGTLYFLFKIKQELWVNSPKYRRPWMSLLKNSLLRIKHLECCCLVFNRNRPENGSATHQ